MVRKRRKAEVKGVFILTYRSHIASCGRWTCEGRAGREHWPVS